MLVATAEMTVQAYAEDIAPGDFVNMSDGIPMGDWAAEVTRVEFIDVDGDAPDKVRIYTKRNSLNLTMDHVWERNVTDLVTLRD